MQGRPPTARPQPRPPARGRLAATKASPKGRPATPARDGAYGQKCRLQRDARKEGRLQGTCKGLPFVASTAASKGDGDNHRGGRPLAGRLLAGKGSRRLRRGNDDDAEGERG
ncbi:hypothetical protein B296_00056479, partial [Ensete ventricosum]